MKNLRMHFYLRRAFDEETILQRATLGQKPFILNANFPQD